MHTALDWFFAIINSLLTAFVISSGVTSGKRLRRVTNVVKNPFLASILEEPSPRTNLRTA